MFAGFHQPPLPVPASPPLLLLPLPPLLLVLPPLLPLLAPLLPLPLAPLLPPLLLLLLLPPPLLVPPLLPPLPLDEPPLPEPEPPADASFPVTPPEDVVGMESLPPELAPEQAIALAATTTEATAGIHTRWRREVIARREEQGTRRIELAGDPAREPTGGDNRRLSADNRRLAPPASPRRAVATGAPGAIRMGEMSEQGDGPTRVRAPRIVVRYSKVRVAVVRGPDAGAWLDVAGQPVRIGTADDNDLVLTDDSVSRHHCELEPVAGGMRVRDAGSTNGVFAAGVRVYDALVPFDARLRAGDNEIALAPSGETVEREQTTADRFGDLLGCSPRMRELFADLERIAATDVTLLVEGETGTGKDLAAESVHRASARSAGPFVVFDCGAVSPSLVESELFGHERGAFTGAIQAHAGVFEQADGGTLLLDEIGELPKELQPKLLRALENAPGPSRRRQQGDHVRRRASSPPPTATCAREVARGAFREDLYFRLAAAHVVAPPLRDRMEDLELLVEHFLALERPPRSAGRGACARVGPLPLRTAGRATSASCATPCSASR